MARTALKIVEKPPFYSRDLDLWSEGRLRDAHSLHYSIGLPASFKPEVAAHFIDAFTSKGDIVLDPFCGSGTTPLEASLRGRVAFASDVDPLALKVTRAKLVPADITQLTLQLQLLNLSRPVSSSAHQEYFREFYDIDTFREIVNLKQYCLSKDDSSSRLLQLLAMSLLHGHTAGFFSAYSSPQASLSPDEQRALNIRRRQNPDYRAVMPRILKKAAFALRDGIPSVLLRGARDARVAHRDARDLSYVESGLVDLILTAPPLPFESDYLADTWLKRWFADVSNSSFSSSLAANLSVQEWLDFMNECLLEFARVTASGARAVFDLRKLQVGDEEVFLDEKLIDLVEAQLDRYWEADSLHIAKAPEAKLRGYKANSHSKVRQGEHRLVVFRRR